jgi:hypothetical protein
MPACRKRDSDVEDRGGENQAAMQGVQAMNTHRNAAGAIAIIGQEILLLRYGTGKDSFLVGPGGGVEPGESVEEAVVRETLEETGVMVIPQKVLWVETLIFPKYTMTKTWALCKPVGGIISRTPKAIAEGITGARWRLKGSLHGETVFPPPLMQTDWAEFRSDSWTLTILPPRKADR